LACGDQRRLTGSGSALEVVRHDYALYKSTFTMNKLDQLVPPIFMQDNILYVTLTILLNEYPSNSKQNSVHYLSCQAVR